MSDFQELTIPLADGYQAYARYWPPRVPHRFSGGGVEDRVPQICPPGGSIIRPSTAQQPETEPSPTASEVHSTHRSSSFAHASPFSLPIWSASAFIVPRSRPAVLHLHGIQSHCGWYTMAATALQLAGFAVLQPDRRGSGQNRNARGHADSAEQLINDAIIYARKLCELAGVDRVHVIGVSWGGKLAVALHVTDPSLAASLTLVAPGIFPIIDVSAAEKFRIGWAMVSEPQRHFPIPLNDPTLFTKDPHWIKFLEQDPDQLHECTAAFYLASRRMDRICNRIRSATPVPVHLYLAGEERIIDVPRTQTYIRDLDWPNRHITTYPASRHTLEFGDDKDAFLASLTRWLISPAEYDTLSEPSRSTSE